jgi:thymidylate synthase
LRKSFVKTGAAEVAWMLSGEQSTEWISKYTGIWKMFEDDNNPGTISTAYGYRWQHAFGVDQIANIIDKLKADPSSRQQVLMSWDASRDNVIPVKNVPCPYTAVINIIDGKLNIHLTLRSNDIIVGLPYDFLMYTLLGKLLANSLEVQVGVLSYAIAHAHIYENHYVMCSQMLITPYNKANETVSFMDTIEDARLYPDLFVASVTSNAMLTYKPNDWNPKPEVVQ